MTPRPPYGGWREFHVSRAARDLYQFDQTLFATNGTTLFADFRAARAFAQKLNAHRDMARHPEHAAKAGHLNALGLMDEILHFIASEYRQQENPDVLEKALVHLEKTIGADETQAVLQQFVSQFPPNEVYRGAVSVDEYLADKTASESHRHIALEELLMLWLSNKNPAAANYAELFDDADLEAQTAYSAVIKELHVFFATQPAFGPDNENLLDMLRRPALAAPHSLEAQLEYVRRHWGSWAGLTDKFLSRLLGSLDLIQEEDKPVFFGPGPSEVPIYGDEEFERFSADLDWMPRVVLLAKNAYVWLEQLSKQYGRAITRLNEIPDEELSTLASRGITGLWLIGLWERSTASKRIKRLCGNPEAEASAYSLKGYEVSGDLGGPDAMHNLRERAWRFGIRMASDMVPNHMGIDSHWVMDHPEWFLSLPYSPFPAYSFNGENLGNDRTGIYLEDHYYDKTDAAVVFKRVDFETGEECYVYHGNDGTSMPWNDTAQLNYLLPQVREAVIQTILHVARQFPIIRFDAAMTLAKRHYERLWFPEPGSGGAIPSRAEHSLSKEQFNAAFPEEFWREVVDRVAAEAPNTLLLAEAFWMMEGYFVRTLGMHRVYNSAFMNMLRDEENAKYRYVMKNTLEFDPEILKRFVNFMNNPDEDTAVDRFGKGDKYFGICTLMATLPGLPMFGHGQFEGFAEKYGMEYRRAYWDETPDQQLMERHQREIFPLLHRRYIFSEVHNFQLYDFWMEGGHVNEDVFAYSNRSGDERALIVYHNKYSQARGWIRNAVGHIVKNADGSKEVKQSTLGAALTLKDSGFTIFRDNTTGLEYIRHSAELCERGLYVELEAYDCHVFLDFRDVQGEQYAQLAEYLNGRGVPNIEAALREMALQPILQPFDDLINADFLRRAATGKASVLQEVETKTRVLLRAVHEFAGGQGDVETAIAATMRELQTVLQLSQTESKGKANQYLQAGLKKPGVPGALLIWPILTGQGRVLAPDDAAAESRSRFDEWQLNDRIGSTLQALGASHDEAEQLNCILKILLAQSWQEKEKPKTKPSLSELTTALFSDADTQRFLGMNRYDGVLWLNEENFEQLVWWLYLAGKVTALCDLTFAKTQTLERAAKAAEYQVEALLDALEMKAETRGQAKA